MFFIFCFVKDEASKEYCFLFQAEVGIRYGHVTGVQTCALPILAPPVEQNSNRAPTLRAASSTLTVPTTFTSASSAGHATDARTSICAARWQISSGLASSTSAASC